MKFSASRIAAIVGASTVVLLGNSASAAVLSNGLSSSSLGYWSVDVLSGGQTRSGSINAIRQDTNALTGPNDIVYDYFTYLKVGGSAFQLSQNDAVTTSGNSVISTGSFTGANGNLINWSSTSTIASGSSVLTNTFKFTSSSALGALGLYQYLDEDVAGAGNDVFFTRGSVASNDLQLFTIDNSLAYGIAHSGGFTAGQGLSNASFKGWSVSIFDNMRSLLAAGTQQVSQAGVVDSGLGPVTNTYVGAALGPTDIVSVLAWDADPNATSATIVTTLGGVPDINNLPVVPTDPTVPEPGSLALVGLAVAGLLLSRRRA